MGKELVEVQQTDRFFLFGVPGTSSKFKWPRQTEAVAATKKSIGIGQPTDRVGVRAESRTPKMTSEGLSAATVSVGARKVLPEDVLLVAVHGARVDLHPASLDKACPVSCKEPKGGDKTFDVRCDGKQQVLSAERCSADSLCLTPSRLLTLHDSAMISPPM